jgi:hypothetical protein
MYGLFGSIEISHINILTVANVSDSEMVILNPVFEVGPVLITSVMMTVAVLVSYQKLKNYSDFSHQDRGKRSSTISLEVYISTTAASFHVMIYTY